MVVEVDEVDESYGPSSLSLGTIFGNMCDVGIRKLVR